MCVQQNAPGARTCESCGNALPGAAGPPAPAKKRPQQGKPQGTRPEPLTFFQSWKFTAMIGAILVVAIFLYKNYQPTATTSAPPQGQSLSPNAAAAVEQIESLQRE